MKASHLGRFLIFESLNQSLKLKAMLILGNQKKRGVSYQTFTIFYQRSGSQIA